jgi:hypothetical protein
VSFADDVERYGRAVQSGRLSMDRAVLALGTSAVVHGVSLTPLGLRDVLENWQTYRSRMEQFFDGVEQSLRELEGEV